MSAPDLFKILDTVDSTNNYAMGQIHAGMASHGMLWFTRNQTAGKGQRGKIWKMERGKNIAMSLVLTPEQLGIKEQFHLSAAVALACVDFFLGYADDETKIKWPNDLFWRDRKAGGILIENVFQGKTWKWAVVGIGININQTKFDKFSVKAVSLKQITGKEFDIINLAKELYDRLMINLSELNTGSTDIIMDKYNACLYKRNKKVMLKKGNKKFETVIKGVLPQGRLVTVDAVEHEFDFGEVEWIL